jgi:glyoxylase-like metal-dependent hydrolase (beta-lactamase superfamily II)/ferredoxin
MMMTPSRRRRSMAWLVLIATPAMAFTRPLARVQPDVLYAAKPRRLEDNVEGVVYVNEKCINCAACSHFAPSVFHRLDQYHVVYHQPDSPFEVDQARAALAACPVAAIRLQTQLLTKKEKELAVAMALSPDKNNIPLPFPRPLLPDVYFVGYHNEGSFGATPYLTEVKYGGDLVWIMIDTPRLSKLSKEAVISLTGPKGPDYLLLTHVDDTAGHQEWVREFPSLKRIFHAGDLGVHNWIGDASLENVEILLPNIKENGEKLTMYSLNGTVLQEQEDDMVILHTPGHSPGSISLYLKSHRVLFTGDCYAFTTRTMQMTGFPQYGNNLRKQASTLRKLLNYDWDVIAPGHGHHKDYRMVTNKEQVKCDDVEHAIDEMKQHRRW